MHFTIIIPSAYFWKTAIVRHTMPENTACQPLAPSKRCGTPLKREKQKKRGEIK
jgi:hypothetical protein